MILGFVCAGVVSAWTASLDVGTGRIMLGADARAWVEFPDNTRWPTSNLPVIALEYGGTNAPATSLSLSDYHLVAGFANGAKAEFQVKPGKGFALFKLLRLDSPAPASRLKLFRLAAPLESRVSGTVNGAAHQGNFIALMAGTPNVHAFHQQSGGSHLDRPGCSHQLTLVPAAKHGAHAGQFTATCDPRASGWSMAGRTFPNPLNLSGCSAIRAWVHGDGKGEAFKIQLYDGAGGYRDDYIKVDFTGWRQFTLTNPALNTLRYEKVSTLNLYYNGLPASTTVTCLVDHIEALLPRDGKTESLVLEDFEDPSSPLVSSPSVDLSLETVQAHGIEPASFGVIACPETQFPEVVQRFEAAAGLPSPKPDAVWNKLSPRVKRSYLFLTNFRETQVEQGLALARRGGFDTVLFGQESWSQGTGHYDINRSRYADGLEGLKRTLDRFKEAGFHVGLHFLAASIYPPDRYITPVPDPRLVKGASGVLAADISATNTFLPLESIPAGFPDEDGGYEGAGMVLQLGNELITYALKSKVPPGFAGCKRGHLGTRPAPHQAGEAVRHLIRAYGYHLYDLDTSIADEVGSNFAAVANACGIQMVYFDGSERLQGEHWYYNARLHKTFYDHLKDKDTLLQASSYSHYSWHMLARSASADGHGDLKGYLDQRSGSFDWMGRDWMPLDIGWYYGYDPTATPDMFEYVLCATLGYDSSMSFQVSCDAAAAHPFTGEILDLIARYEKLRLSGKLPEAVKARLRIHPDLRSIKPGESQPELVAKRREFRLMEAGNKPFLQRVVYGPWLEVTNGNGSWKIAVPESGSSVGVQIQAPKGAEMMDPEVTLGNCRWVWEGAVTNGQFVFFWPDEPVKKYAPGLIQPEQRSLTPSARLSGELAARFTCARAAGAALKVRFTFQSVERIDF